MHSISFGSGNQGLQVGHNYGSINTEFHLPLETPPQPFATIPFSRDLDFVNRGDILDQIDERCSKPAARVALVGLGGVGKSQLAIEFAHRIDAEQPDTWVFWVHAGTQARVEEGFRTIADAIKLPGRNQAKANIPQLVYHWLSNERNGRWIMILDSADDRDIFYDPTSGDARNGRPFATYLPQSRNGSIIITTRNQDLASWLTGHRQNIIEVGPMARTDALTLLEKKLGSLADTDMADDLVQALDFVPLAISQAAAYIQARAPRSSPEKYLAEFRESECKKGRLLEYDGGDLRRDGGASNAILTTWQISFDYIRSKQPSAADLLSLMSFFDRQGIPGWVLNIPRISKEAMQGRSQNKDSTLELDDSSSATDDDTDDGTDDDIDSGFEDDVAMLRDYCLITTNEVGDEFEMHGLVQLSTRRWLEAFGREEVFKKQYIERLTASFPTGQYENWATCRSLFAHVQVAFGYQPSEDTLEIWATLLHNGGWYAWSQGVYEVAQQMLGKARKVRKRRLGKDDMATLASTSIFAMVLSNQGRWEEAKKLFVQVMETRKTKLGADHPSTLTSMANLASTFCNQGRWEEAEKLEVQVMETRKTKLGADHPSTMTSMANLASTYRNQGRWEEAEKLEVQVMETRKTKLGADHPSTLTSMANLASTFWNQGRWEEAEKLFVQVMETRKTKLGADHPSTLTSMANLASTYRNQGRWEEAEKLEVQVMETRKTKLGADHPDTLTSMANLASTFWNQGRWEEAEKLFVQVMETSKTKLGADHPSTLTSMANLASTYRNQGRWKKAEKLDVQVMETSKTKLGADHPDTLTSMANLASTFWNQGRWEEAEKLDVQVMESRKTKLGADHPDTLTSMANLASTYRNQGRWEEAEKLFVQVMETRKTKLGADHPSTLTSMANLASTFWNQGRWEEAEKLFVQVMETSKTKLGADHPDTLLSMNNLAFTWKDHGRHSDAIALMEECSQARQRVLGAGHPDTLSSLAAIAEWSS
ncbi:hypothetical protein B0T22DRAFT_491771 [Podospora appendiculata]|uniref:NB-ARC domain-containing protein n=1 Tax=Podospora appendiculata TaxID=314037 RepID=A0AAE1CEM6_9PEZI|nr:hypothetical protein B0T22DRAFT_491771 [Podospora appendiculata]